jgi:hypothetical protein
MDVKNTRSRFLRGRNRKDRKETDKSEGIGHVLETGLPPGVSIDEAKDPGSQPPDKPKTGRSPGRR